MLSLYVSTDKHLYNLSLSLYLGKLSHPPRFTLLFFTTCQKKKKKERRECINISRHAPFTFYEFYSSLRFLSPPPSSLQGK